MTQRGLYAGVLGISLLYYGISPASLLIVFGSYWLFSRWLD
jgi:hypothetical protein